MDNKTDNIVKRKPGRPKKLDSRQEEKQDLSLPAMDPVKRKRGRPVGSKNKSIRKDHDINALTKPGDNSVFIRYSLALSNLPKIDMNDITQVNNRIMDFFNISASYDIKPCLAALALSFHVNRITLFNWITEKTGTIKNAECLNAIKNAHNMIGSQYEILMNEGKINPVSGIFLLKNNYGYKDTTDYIISANTEKEDNTSDIYNRAGLLD